MRRGRPPYPGRLTPREQQVLELLREGLTNRQIGERLGISQAGAAYHVSEILSKLGVSSREEAVGLPREETLRKAWGLAALPSFFRRSPLEVAVKVSVSLVAAGFVALVTLIAIGIWVMQVRADAGALAVECVTGEAAQNRAQLGGGYITSQLFVETTAEAEAWLCVDIPEIALPDGWESRGARVIRTHSLAEYEEGEWVTGHSGLKRAEVYYGSDRLKASITLIAYPDEVADQVGAGFFMGSVSCFEEPDALPIVVQGVATTLNIHRAPQAVPTASVCWQRDGWNYIAGVIYQPGFDPVQDFLPLLESME